MKKFKIVLWVIIIAFLILLFFQNKDFFLTKNALMINLGVIEKRQSIELPNAVWILAALCIGFLIAYFFALIEKFKINRLIKGLNAKADAQDQMIAQLKQEIASNQGGYSNEVVDTQTVDVSTPESEIHKLPSDVS